MGIVQLFRLDLRQLCHLQSIFTVLAMHVLNLVLVDGVLAKAGLDTTLIFALYVTFTYS